MARDSVQRFGMKITGAQREYYRYTDVSAEVERRGCGSNTHDFTRLLREQQPVKKDDDEAQGTVRE